LLLSLGAGSPGEMPLKVASIVLILTYIVFPIDDRLSNLLLRVADWLAMCFMASGHALLMILISL
jgi:hypothetical protein